MTPIPEIRARSKADDDAHLNGLADQSCKDRAALLTHLDAMAKRLKEARRHVKIGGRAMQIIDEALKQAGYDT